MSNYPQLVLDWTLDVIFPKKCLGCAKFINYYICRKCFGGIKIKNTLECIGCKRKTQFGFTCINCKVNNSIDQLLVATDLSDSLLDRTLKVYKYNFVSELSVPLFRIIKRCVKNLLSKRFNVFEGNPLIIPVPLSRKRLNWRGFNQAELLAVNISDSFHMDYRGDVLKRSANSKHQADIKLREERLGNVKNNFFIETGDVIRDRTIILVDDICTTGATLSECAKVLKENGSKKVIGLVIARGKFK